MKPSWVTRPLLGIVLATFFSDFSHEMCTAVLPLYLASIGLGPASLGLMEGAADFLVSMSKLAGGIVGHRLHRKRELASAGYLVTSLATAAMGAATTVVGLLSLRSVAWVARGFRSPLRDHMLADAVLPTHYGRAYGLERSGDMLGAVAGPLTAAVLVMSGLAFRDIIIWTVIPGGAAAAAMFFMTRPVHDTAVPAAPSAPTARFPATYWRFIAGVSLFGLGDFSRTFLIWLAARDLGQGAAPAGGFVSKAVLLYAFHSVVATLSAYPVGRLGDRGGRKISVLIAGYALGVVTNTLLAFFSHSLAWLVFAIALSGVYVSIEETLEKAAAAELVPRELRSLGFGYLAFANALGDMVSSLYIGAALHYDHPGWGFGLAAILGATGVVWMITQVWSAPRAPSTA